CEIVVRISICFFFSSRRRHTRSKRDWSSDVCSSDLIGLACAGGADTGEPDAEGERIEPLDVESDDRRADEIVGAGPDRGSGAGEIGRASCRERVEVGVGAVSLEKIETEQQERVEQNM